jgi:putative transposase
VKTQAIDALTDDLELVTRIKAIHVETGQCYGSRRMAKALHDEGYEVGRHKVRRLMKEAGVSVRRRRPRQPQTTDSRHGYGVAPHVLNREFDVATPNAAWVGDITYLWTQEGGVVLGGVAGLVLAKSGGLVPQ